MHLRTPMTDVELERWEMRRSVGKCKFVARKAVILAFQFFMLWNIMLSLFTRDFYQLGARQILGSLLGSIVFGIFAAIVVWWENDSRYQNTILDEKIRKGFELDSY